MLRVLSVVFCLVLLPSIIQARTPKEDRILTVIYKKRLVAVHKVKLGETIFMLARRYHVPPAMLADANGLNYQSSLGKTIYIPLGAYNRLKVLPSNLSETRVLYYKTGRFDNLYMVAKYVGVRQKVLQGWNNMASNKIEEGQYLKVGWILYDDSQKPFAKKDSSQQSTNTNIVSNKIKNRFGNADTIITLKPKDSLSKVERRYRNQTSDETFVSEEKGTAVFFPMSVKNTKVHYAFYNKAARGTIIKVVNPGTNKYVFVKVLGNLPKTKQYHNAVIGISETAKKDLLVSDSRAWCELFYSPRP